MRTVGALAGLLLAATLLGCAPAPVRPPTAADDAAESTAASELAIHREPAPRKTRNRSKPPSPSAAPTPPPAPAATAEAVLARLAARMREPHCSDPSVRRAASLQLRNRRALGEKLERVLPLLDYVLAGVEARDLPGQFALIPWAESGFRADPGNRGSVQGLWQFTVSTGRGQGLRIDQRFDGRRAAIESTDAALDHLHDLMTRFEDWRLAILAYNVGPNGLARALARRPPGAPALPTGLPAHSYIYLHKITALACMLASPQRHDIPLPREPFDRLVATPRPRHVHSIHQLARSAGVETELLLQYNAGFRGGDIVDDAPPIILLPEQAAARLAGRAPSPGPTLAAAQNRVPLAEPVKQPPVRRGLSDHVVSAGETLWRIARRHGVALTDLLRWNGLDSGSIIRPGQRLKLAPTH